MVTLAEYRDMISKFAQEGAGFPRDAAYAAVAAEHGRDAAEQVDRRLYREVLAD